ncbi:MAG: hypothetical protein M3Q46_05810 [Verrucomicrobiota bacterium]|nr:hypothetical protein [Verrucomicrobiota bacterium]
MKLASVATILDALNTAEVRALVVGGLAVNAHGYLRFTKDADLAVDLVPENIERASEPSPPSATGRGFQLPHLNLPIPPCATGGFARKE